MKRDLHQEITDQIIDALEAGVEPWKKSWNGGGHALPTRVTGEAYLGINVLILWMAQARHGYTSNRWMTYQQAAKLGGQVQAGKGFGATISKWGTFKRADKATGEEKTGAYMKSYTVFNTDRIDGLPQEYYPTPPTENHGIEAIAHADHFFRQTAVHIENGGDRAYYRPSTDTVQMPELGCFDDAEAYYATLAHEVTHATSHADRCDRPMLAARFGDNHYAFEELVAELGAAFVCAELELSPSPRADHASYIQGWLKVLKADKKAIFSAATLAAKAADWMRDQQGAAGETTSLAA